MDWTSFVSDDLTHIINMEALLLYDQDFSFQQKAEGTYMVE